MKCHGKLPVQGIPRVPHSSPQCPASRDSWAPQHPISRYTRPRGIPQHPASRDSWVLQHPAAPCIPIQLGPAAPGSTLHPDTAGSRSIPQHPVSRYSSAPWHPAAPLIPQHPTQARQRGAAQQSPHGQAPLLGFALSRCPCSPSCCLCFLGGGEQSDNQPGHQESSWTRLKANQRRKIVAWFMSS